MGVGISHGVTIAFETSSFTAKITDIKPFGMSRDSVDTSHQGTDTYRTFLPGSLVDAGEMSFDFQYDPSTTPPIDQDIEPIVITFADLTTNSFNGFMTNFEPNAPHGDLMTASATVKLSGGVGMSAA